MTSTDRQRERLIGLLEQLFQLDQPDLDFGFYKIMHAKAEGVRDFLCKDLLEIIKAAFGEADEAKIEEARLKYEQAVEQAKSFGAPDPEATQPVQEAKAAYDAAKDSGANEGEIYEHLYRFFERYYDNGDFMSRRYFARESGGKAAPYAVPYDGREVYLHWANRDQYYIKTSEHLTNFTFDIAHHFTAEQRVTYNMPDSLKLHCRIVDAAEGEHNNNKTRDKNERFFLIHAERPAVMEDGALVLQFEYRPDQEKSGQAGKWQEGRIDEAEAAILEALSTMAEASDHDIALRTEIGEDNSRRTLLRKYLNRYTKRNTSDYFIHKDLGGFLGRELDFYIKNEIMRLDDIESADAPRVQAYLEQIKVLRKIAGHLITFLAQLEEFQKKLWLKKKFVTETQYCLTLERIPEDMYPQIAANDAQRAEWVRLFAIDDIEGDLTTPGYSEPLSVDFLKANPFLVLDTALFPSDFKDSLIAKIADLDASLDGLLIHSENFQALGLMQEKKKRLIDGIYIDPPYNTDATKIVYKNGYKHSSWASLLQNRLDFAKNLIREKGITCTTVDDYEIHNLAQILKQTYDFHDLRHVIIEYNHRGRVKSNFATTHEYALWTIPSGQDLITRQKDVSDDIKRNLRRTGTASKRYESPSQFYGIEVEKESLKIISVTNALDVNAPIPEHSSPNTLMIWPIDNDGVERRWYYGKDRILPEAQKGTVYAKKIKGEVQIHYWQEGQEKRRKTVWVGSDLDASTFGSELLNDIFGMRDFDFPKSIYAVEKCVASISDKQEANILDYFAGSGTTGHAVVNLNREDGGRRKYIMVEMGDYFDAVTRPRMQKVVYSRDWKDGKPVSHSGVSHGGVSHAFKYIRLESYEDTLNNLRFKQDTARDQVLQDNDDFRREYMLQYWLEFETRGSPSLLNIAQFDDPTAYTLKLKKPGSDAYEHKAVDMIESFHWLIGLHVDHLDQWRRYAASFTREHDPELPQDQDTGEQDTRLILDGGMEESAHGAWHFRKVEGRVCRTPGDMHDTERVLVIWRKLTGDLERDNAMLDAWFKKYCPFEGSEFDTIYVNGSNNLPNLRQDHEHWEVRLIEEAFHQRMWSQER